jgi:hypothetical protein
MTASATRRRAGRVTLAALAAALAAVLVLLELPGAGHAAPAASMPSTAKATAFSQTMDKLWEDHIVWTRMVIVDFAAGLPDLKTAETRLLRNQTEIGNAIKPYYGIAAGDQLTKLLRTHILEAVPVLAQAKAGNEAKLTKALDAWYTNANEIAAFLSKANPGAWPLDMTSAMMKRHLQLTTAEAVARLQGHWSADVAAYDKVHAEILAMSQMLSNGIIQQFPERF